MSQRLCYPYGAGISCTCDSRKRILRCVPVVDSLQSARVGTGGMDDGLYDDLEADSLEDELGHGAKVGDERTEIILAATFLLIVILSFIAFIIHRCERNLYQRKHLGCLNTEDMTGQSVPKSLSTVSIQTVPIMSGNGGMGALTGYTNGEISTISRTLNGGTRLQDVHIAMEGLGHAGVHLYRAPSIQSQDHLSPDSHLPISPPVSAAEHHHLYQDPPGMNRNNNNEDMIESALAGLEQDYRDDRGQKM